MKKVYLQYWEESERGWGIRPDGCSLHKTIQDCENYIKSVYSKRTKFVPDEYDREVGTPIEVMVKEELYSLINNGYLRLFTYELNNLIKLEEIVPICNI